MAGANKNFYRKKAMTEYGQEHQFFRQTDLMWFMNNYTTAEGRRHRMTQTHKHQLTSILKRNPNFTYWPERKEWEYVGEPKPNWNRNENNDTSN